MKDQPYPQDSIDQRQIRRVQSNNEGLKVNSVSRNMSNRRPETTNRSIELSEGRERTDVSYNIRFGVYLSILTACFFFNLDNGVFPPTLIKIEKDLHLNEKSVAILNGVTFLVCGFFTIFVAPLYAYFDAKKVLTWSAMFNSIGTFIFIGTENYNLMVIGRAMSGLS